MSDYCISITNKNDMSIKVIYHAMSQTTVSVSLRRGIRISQWFITLCLTTVSVSQSVIGLSQWVITLYLTTVSVSLGRVIALSQWFIMPWLWLLYQYHEEEWYVHHSELSRYVWLLHQYHKEELYIYSSHLSWYVSDYCISITKKSDRSFTVSYHGMSLTTASVSQRSEIGLSQWVVMLCLWLLYQYHKEVW